ncbi:hypothetical protein H0A36_22450 [Endozoicomonas sp. SM1973]|uniref:YscD/Y4YQ C-terminal domain-containing protein n=1 Tax=Spartinivicinus marinus TaxID=2994442 RepID=A0A853IAF6_9GAMM|nr:hypothetical protein [Spartinivicinus marinus]MCX4029068.1 hypothetical protein [Spartinivicinus marinus]NYZ68782.1 hypothetical protein [Spartinivicinus marinus]
MEFTAYYKDNLINKIKLKGGEFKIGCDLNSDIILSGLKGKYRLKIGNEGVELYADKLLSKNKKYIKYNLENYIVTVKIGKESKSQLQKKYSLNDGHNIKNILSKRLLCALLAIPLIFVTTVFSDIGGSQYRVNSSGIESVSYFDNSALVKSLNILLKQYENNLSIDYISESQVVLSGFIYKQEELKEIINYISKDLGIENIQVDRVHSISKINSFLLKLLKNHKIESFIEIDYKLGQFLAYVPHNEINSKLVSEILRTIEVKYEINNIDMVVPDLNKLVFEELKLISTWGGNKPYIKLSDKVKYSVRETLPSGWKLDSIKQKKLQFVKKDKKITLVI